MPLGFSIIASTLTFDLLGNDTGENMRYKVAIMLRYNVSCPWLI